MNKSTAKGHLVVGHLERVSRPLLEEHKDVINEYVEGQHGIYALYKNGNLYYVGLARNLPKRLSDHLKDHHQGDWDEFSLYVTKKEEHMRELESLLLRIMTPKGNRMIGKLTGSENLKGHLRRMLNEQHRDRMARMLGKKKTDRIPRAAVTVSVRRRAIKSDTAALAPYVSSRFEIRMTFRGEVHKATVRSDGKINFNGNVYETPTGAAKIIIGGGQINGWASWRYKNGEGAWVPLKEIRQGKVTPNKEKGRPTKWKERQNTIVCPAGHKAFEDFFLKKGRWSPVRIRKDRIDDLKFIAIYIKRPMHQITHYAKIKSIKRDPESGKYIIRLDGTPKKLRQEVGFTKKGTGNKLIAAPVFTTIRQLRAAKTLDEI